METNLEGKGSGSGRDNDETFIHEESYKVSPLLA